MDHCLRSVNYVNVIVADKQDHIQYLNIDGAIDHCTKGLGIWDWASNDQGEEPDIVMASCGDVSTHEALAATALLRENLPKLKIRFVNVVDLFRLMSDIHHPHGMHDRQWKAIFTEDKPILFNFHSYPWLIHRLTYKRAGQENLHVRGYKEKGNIDTPFELAMRNGTDRYTLAIDAIDLLPSLGNTAASVREKLVNAQLAGKTEAYNNGIDPEHIRNWVWPYGEG